MKKSSNKTSNVRNALKVIGLLVLGFLLHKATYEAVEYRQALALESCAADGTHPILCITLGAANPTAIEEALLYQPHFGMKRFTKFLSEFAGAGQDGSDDQGDQDEDMGSSPDEQ